MINTLRRWGLLIVLVAVFLAFYILVPQFRSFNNFMNIVRAATLMGIFALGLTVIINAGEFDLSFPAIGTIAAAIGGVILLSNGVSLTVTVIVALLGATFLKEGIPNVSGNVVATILMAALANGFTLMGLPLWFKEIAEGLILASAVAIVRILKTGGIPPVVIGK